MASKGDGSGLCKAFGAAVRARREHLGLSQEELGFRCELDRSYLSDVERGKRNPTLKSVARIARALRTRPSALLLAAEGGQN